MSIHTLNPKAEFARRGQALEINITAAEGIMQLLRTNFGPTGTLKMLVSGSGDIKTTKDGAVLLEELPIQHPTASLIARTATAQDDITGDGTTTCIILIGELLRQARRWLSEDVHPRVLADGFELARRRTVAFLDDYKIPLPSGDTEALRKVYRDVAFSSVCTKVHSKLAESLADIVTDAVLIADRSSKEKGLLDLHMVEIMSMGSRSDMDTSLIRGLVLDHGSRQHELQTLSLTNCHILILDVSLEYEKSEVNTGYFFKDADEQAKQAEQEREIVNRKCRAIIALKDQVCKEGEEFVVFNQKGVDPLSLDLLAEHGIVALRRVKRRNMERLSLCCGGSPKASLDSLTPADLGWADHIHEEMLGDEKYTFVEGVRDPKSCTILIRGPSAHVLVQVKDAVRDGLRAVKNIITDKCFVPGAGAFEVAAAQDLEVYKKELTGKVKLGVQAFADALMAIPKTLARNSGFDPQDSMLKVEEAQARTTNRCGLSIKTGEALDAVEAGILDNYRVKHQLIHSATVIATQLLLVDEILKAGRAIRSEVPADEAGEE